MIKSLIEKQYGQFTGNTQKTMDSLLSKLTCHRDDEYPGILSTANNATSSDLVYACKFSPSPGYEHIVALANEEGKVALQNTKLVGKSRPIQGFQAHGNAVFDICWSPHSNKMITGSGDQSCVLWDLDGATVEPISKFTGHVASVKTVDFCPTNASLFASGSRDGSIMLWDLRSNGAGCRYTNSIFSKPENVIKNAHSLQSQIDPKSSRSKKKNTPNTSVTVNSVTAVIFQNEHTLISSGATDGSICVWDLRKNYMIYKGDPVPKTRIHYGSFSNRSGISSLCLDPGRTLLYAASADDVIYEFNVASYDENPVGIYGGHEQHTFYIKTCLSGDGKYLLSGSSDDHAYIWRVGAGPRPLLKLDGHGAEVTCVAWCPNDITNVVTCADDVRHRVWRLNTCSEADFDEKIHIRGRCLQIDGNSQMPTSYQEVLNRIEKKKATLCNQPTTSHCKTPSSLRKFASISIQRTPEPSSFPGPSASNTPRMALSPVPSNISPEANSINSRGASRRLDMEPNLFASPTSDLPNLVMDGRSPHRPIPRSSTKRKRLDWLTDLSRKMTPNKCRKIK